ncbi:ABC transporter ATP-binding protein [Inquilinus sp. Marseille-Q2685]|uniref:ABC transporter ATP-binding protein n=1 Tax=Inquilinus sp. Marseille-Q2685 TaxID=2866581 RepID=UPI001CE3E404|nr:ABC transporter ATP-binding protein [Inquilinus sp. Marseille-Q2685]
MTGTAIDVVDVTKVFGSDQSGAVRALNGVSVQIRDNEFFTLLGPSGCGKTTLLRMIAGFEEPTSGHILLHGKPIEGLPPHRRPVNTVFQSYALFPHMTVRENIRFGLEMKGVERARADARVAEMIALVKLGGMENRKPAQLSGGQQQRVALARALASEPQVLLLDEPLSALDLKLRKEMQIELKRLQTETGITFIFVTHDQEEALTMSDRIAVMSQGEILQIGGPRDIYDRPERRFVAHFIGETNLFDGPLAARLGCADGATLAVRPERILLSAEPGPDSLAGTVETVVYVGTDTTYHVRLAEGGALVTARLQNRTGAPQSFQPGDRVGIAVPAGAGHALAD